MVTPSKGMLLRLLMKRKLMLPTSGGMNKHTFLYTMWCWWCQKFNYVEHTHTYSCQQNLRKFKLKIFRLFFRTNDERRWVKRKIVEATFRKPNKLLSLLSSLCRIQTQFCLVARFLHSRISFYDFQSFQPDIAIESATFLLLFCRRDEEIEWTKKKKRL